MLNDRAVKVSVLGTGYVGLVSGVCLAAKGHDVTCLDVNDEIVRRINAGDPHIFERGLEPLLRQTLASGRFRAAPATSDSIGEADVVLIAVGTPSVGGRIDLRFVESAARLVGEYLRTAGRYVSVVVKSTVVPGTTDTFVRSIIEQVSGLPLGKYGLGMNPEFLREGDAIEDFMEPDRIVIGFEDAGTLEVLRRLYAPWPVDVVEVNSRTAELIKYANNCLLATQISAVNEIANIAAAIGGIDVADVMHGVHLDRRWNPIGADGRRVNPAILTYLWPGCGFGGSCFPKDVQALRSQAELAGVPAHVLDAVLRVNEAQPLEAVGLLERSVGSLAGKRVLVLGLAFKPGTDDVRESAALHVVRRLVELGAQVQAHDPVASHRAREALGAVPVQYVDDWAKSLKDVDAIVIATKWPEYSALGEMQHRSTLAGKVIVDARRLFDGSEFPGSRYLAIGLTERDAGRSQSSELAVAR